MDCISCKSNGEICNEKNAEKCGLHTKNNGTPLIQRPSLNHNGTLTPIETPGANGFIYEKCKFCGSIIIRRIAYGASENGMRYYHQNYGDVSDFDTAMTSNESLEPSPYYTGAETAGVDGGERTNSAVAYSMRLGKSGCAGICIRRDTGACDGSRCGACEVSAAKLCSKRFLVTHDNADMLERDGGDYRNLMGGFFRRVKYDGEYDEKYKQKLSAEEAKANAYRDELRSQVVGADDANLKFEWREYTLDDMLNFLPHIERRPVRIEIQIFIYLFYNYRFAIDLEHAETRFQLPKLAINRYMRAYFGQSYSSLLAKMRNEHSKILLRIPLLQIGEIGALVGYKSHYHYSLNFKRYEGISPKEYRQFMIGKNGTVGDGTFLSSNTVK